MVFGDFGDPVFGEAERGFGEAERDFGDFGDPDFGDFGDPDFGDFGERDFGDFGDPDFGDFGDPDFGEAERRFGEAERRFADSAHRFASISALACGVSDWGPTSTTRPALRLVTLVLRCSIGSGIPYIRFGGINPFIILCSNSRILAILICVSIFNMLQSHKFAVPSSQPVAKNLPLG